MPTEATGWFREVIDYSIRRPVIKMERIKRLYSLQERIEGMDSLGKIAIIAEYKRKSPSGLNIDRDPVEYARFVEKYVAGLSVLTEEKYFGGSYQVLMSIASITNVPILMKDFIVCENQIDTAYNIGADAVLLITSILSEKELENLYNYAVNLGLEVVVEVHDLNDLSKALVLNPKIIGVNSRNLKTLELRMNDALNMLKLIPDTVVKVAESGIKTKEDIMIFKNAGAKAFLIGTELMKNPLKLLTFIT